MILEEVNIIRLRFRKSSFLFHRYKLVMFSPRFARGLFLNLKT